jgi:hypothetical protein
LLVSELGPFKSLSMKHHSKGLSPWAPSFFSMLPVLRQVLSHGVLSGRPHGVGSRSGPREGGCQGRKPEAGPQGFFILLLSPRRDVHVPWLVSGGNWAQQLGLLRGLRKSLQGAE